MATQQKTEDKTDTSQQQARNEQSATGQSPNQGSGPSTQARQQNREEGSRAMQRRQVTASFSPFMMGPFALIRGLQEEIDRAFGTAARNQGAMMTSAQGRSAAADQGAFLPPIERFQRDNEFVARVALPGLSADDVVIEVGEDALTIRGERRYEHEEERDGTYVSEFSYGAFARVVSLPPGAIADNARAEIRDGVLEIVVPAPSQEARRGRRLEIQQGQNKR